MNISRKAVALALSFVPGVGSKTITKILTKNDTLCRASLDFIKLSAETIISEYGMRRQSAVYWQESKRLLLVRALRLEEKFDRLGVHMITTVDARYPRQIEAMDRHPPEILYLYGNYHLLDANLFAVMCSRGQKERAHILIEKLVEEGIDQGEVLISGHSTLEYQKASVIPLRWGSPRVLVLDRGLFIALGEKLNEELFRTAKLWRYQFDPSIDLVISPVNSGQKYFPVSNKIRDRLIGGLARRIDFVCLNPNGNMDKIARKALEIKKPVRVSTLSTNYQIYEKLGAVIIS